MTEYSTDPHDSISGPGIGEYDRSGRNLIGELRKFVNQYSQLLRASNFKIINEECSDKPRYIVFGSSITKYTNPGSPEVNSALDLVGDVSSIEIAG